MTDLGKALEDISARLPMDVYAFRREFRELTGCELTYIDWGVPISRTEISGLWIAVYESGKIKAWCGDGYYYIHLNTVSVIHTEKSDRIERLTVESVSR